jgi:diguanylate cyclase (GGDEF)-like protein
MVDIDHFKRVNDVHGHEAGDNALCAVAHELMLGRALVGRLGGEEFAAVLYNVSREKAVALAERIRSAFAEAASEVEGRPVAATVSIGVVLAQDATFDVPALLVQADQALYFAKDRGRNRVEVATLYLVLGHKVAANRLGRVAAKSAA